MRVGVVVFDLDGVPLRFEHLFHVFAHFVGVDFDIVVPHFESFLQDEFADVLVLHVLVVFVFDGEPLHSAEMLPTNNVVS